MLQDYKTETKKAYEVYADEFAGKFKEYWINNDFIRKLADDFVKKLSGVNIVDLGSGPGDFALFFKSKGLKVTCLDISESMIKKCQEKGLQGQVMDIENLDLPELSLDGVWANCSLLHIPKENITGVLQNIARILKPGGLLFSSVLGGDTEGFRERDKHPDIHRWFSNYDYVNQEFIKYIPEDLKLISSFKDEWHNHQFLDYLFKKNET
jgi:SAM-dependent methyltransferase